MDVPEPEGTEALFREPDRGGENTRNVSKLPQMNVGYIPGDSLAAGGPRLEYRFD